MRSTVGGISLLCPLLLRPRPSLSSLLVTDKRPPLSSLPFSTLRWEGGRRMVVPLNTKCGLFSFFFFGAKAMGGEEEDGW